MTVLRWHNNPDPALRNSGDDIDRHQRRVRAMAMELAARIGLPMHNSDLPRACRYHDEAERVTGDTPGPAKRKFTKLRYALAEAEGETLGQMGIAPFDLSKEEWAILHLCDKLDAILWAKAHQAQDPEWAVETCAAWVKARAINPNALAWAIEAVDDPLQYVGADMRAIRQQRINDARALLAEADKPVDVAGVPV